MYAATEEKAGKMPVDRQDDDIALVTYVQPKVKNAFLAKAKDNGSTGAAVIRDFVHKYLETEKTERNIPRDVQEIIPAFADFMSSPPKEKHLRSLWDALWVILKDRAEKKNNRK